MEDDGCRPPHDGAQLPNLIDKQNTASDVWAKRAKSSVKRSLTEWRTGGDTVYRSAKNQERMIRNGLRSQIHPKKPKGKPMPEAIARANGKKSKVRAGVEHVFARQKGPMGLVIHTIGLARTKVKIGLANLTYNMKRMLWLTDGLATA